MTVGKLIELARRFPADAEVLEDGKKTYVYVPKHGYFDIDCSDSWLPWLHNQRAARLIEKANAIQAIEPITAQQYREAAARLK